MDGRVFLHHVGSESDSDVLHLGQGLDGRVPDIDLDLFCHHLCGVFLKIADFLLELVSVSL